MIITVEELKKTSEYSDVDDDVCEALINAMEVAIRKITNNKFQNTAVRFTASSNDDVINGVSTFLKVGDTIEISQSDVNDGLYVVTAIDTDAGTTTVDSDLYAVEENLVTKIEYPLDVKYGFLNLLKYIKRMEDLYDSIVEKIGISSETISRHSVSYDTGNMLLYLTGDLSAIPDTVLGFLNRYKKARF